MATRKRPRAVTIRQYREIETLAAAGWRGKAIHTELGQLGLLDEDGRPDERTVQRIVADLAPSEETAQSEVWHHARERWQLNSTEPEDAAIMLRVLAGVLSTTSWRLPTVGQAEWVVRLHTAAPDLIEQPGGWLELYRFASVYQLRIERGEPTFDLDDYFALAPWRDGGAAYVAAIRSGRLTTVHGGRFTPQAAFDALHEVAKRQKGTAKS